MYLFSRNFRLPDGYFIFFTNRRTKKRRYGELYVLVGIKNDCSFHLIYAIVFRKLFSQNYSSFTSLMCLQNNHALYATDTPILYILCVLKFFHYAIISWCVVVLHVNQRLYEWYGKFLFIFITRLVGAELLFEYIVVQMFTLKLHCRYAKRWHIFRVRKNKRVWSMFLFNVLMICRFEASLPPNSTCGKTTPYKREGIRKE